MRIQTAQTPFTGTSMTAEVSDPYSPRSSSHHRHYGGNRHGGGRSPGSPSSTNAGRYKPSTQAISPPRDSYSEGENNADKAGDKGSSKFGDLRDSLNRNKESRNRYNRG